MPAQFKIIVFSIALMAIFLFLTKPVLASNVLINEVFIGDSSGSHQWVELYNSTNQEIDLSNWIIDDSGGSTYYQISQGTTIGSNSFKVFQSGSFYLNSSSADTVILKNGNNEEIDSYSYSSSPGGSLTFCRSPNGASWNVCQPTREASNLSSSSSPTPTPPPTPRPSPSLLPVSPTPSPSQNSATYQINEVKNEDDDLLSSVKVYLDDVYLHHYAPETLTFCDGCQCDTYVSCGFDEHTIRLEKTDYDDWSETKTIQEGDFYEVNPVMNLSHSENDSLLSPSPSPSSSSTPSPQPVKVIGAP